MKFRSIFLLLFLLSSTGSYAAGLGAYYEFSGIDTHIVDNKKNHPPSGLALTNTGGLIIDTAVAKDKLFNFRFYLGGGYGDFAELWEKGYYLTSDQYHHRVIHYQTMINIDTVYGLGFFRMQYLRLWIGPEVGLGILIPEAAGVESAGVRLQIGAILGMNINIGSLITFSIDGGYRFNVGLIRVYGDPSIEPKGSTDLFYGHEGVLRLSMMFRINDSYSGQQSNNAGSTGL